MKRAHTCGHRSYSKLMAFEASRILHRLGCDVRVYNPAELPIKNDNDEKHHKVQELRDLSRWSDGHVWCTPEQHGILVSLYRTIKPLSLLTFQTGVFKNQIDWIPLSTGSVRPTQGRTLSVIQVNGGSQSFNAVNALRILGRWMRMFCIPNQSSLPMAYTQFTDEGDETSRLKPSCNRDRLVDCMEELVKYTIIMRPRFELFGDRFSERKERKAKLAKETVDADKTREAATKAEEMDTVGVGAEVQSNVNGKIAKVADNVNGVNAAGI